MTAAAQLRPGARVSVVGVSAPGFNGRVGELERFDAESGRWHVRLEGGDGVVRALRPHNLAIAAAVASPVPAGRRAPAQAVAVDVAAVQRGLESVRPQSVAVPPELRPFGDELCAAVVAALRLRQLRGDEEALSHGCHAVAGLSNVAAGNRRVGNAERLLAAGACEAVVAAIGARLDSEQLQFSGCLAVTGLGHVGAADLAHVEAGSRRVANVERLAAAGACEVVVAAMGAWLGSERVQTAGIAAVGNLAVDAASAMKLVAAGVCEAVVAATLAYPRVLLVQCNGCVAIGKLAQR